MAASPSCKSSFATAALLHQRACLAADSCSFQFLPLKSFNGAGGDAISTNASTNQVCRLASVAVAATAWAGLSMCPPLEALALVYETANQSGEWVTSTFTGHFDREGELDANEASIPELVNYMPEVETLVGNVPSIKPPNEGLNSPWVPKINGLKKNSTESKKRMVKCPPWTMSELEMVLPDLQGKPKPFPRTQGQVYPFWPATAKIGGDGRNEQAINQLGGEEDVVLASTPIDAVHDSQDRNILSSPAAAPAPQNQSPMKKPSSCFTM